MEWDFIAMVTLFAMIQLIKFELYRKSELNSFDCTVLYAEMNNTLENVITSHVLRVSNKVDQRGMSRQQRGYWRRALVGTQCWQQ